MPRNTFLLVTFLAIFAALVVGVNIGKRLSTPASIPIPSVTPILTPTPTPIPTTTYINKPCGISFDYPSNFTKQEATSSADGSSGVVFTDPNDIKTMIVLVCQKDIPRISLSPEKIETVEIASISAKLYHDKNMKDGTPIDKLIFYNPKAKLDVFLAGLGTAFDAAVASLKIL